MSVRSPNLSVFLFVPGSRPDRFAKAASSGADAVIIDLEDAVPEREKDRARAALSVDFGGVPVFIRVNGVGTPWHEQDMMAVKALPFAGLILPKAELGSHLIDILNISDIPVLPLIESAKGLSAAREIACLPNVARLLFGSIDFSADLGCAHTRDSLLGARAELVLASRLGGLPSPVDGVTTAIHDKEVVRMDTIYARELGFGGKLAIHPAQIGAIRQGFYPDQNEIEWANEVLAGGDGAININGNMVDEPLRVKARAILGRASR